MTDQLHASFPADAEGHFYLHFFRMLGRVLRNLHHLADQRDERLQRLFQNYPFLAAYEALLMGYAGLPLESQDVWWSDQIERLEARYEGHLPLRALRRALALSPAQVDLLLAVGLVEENIAFGSVFAYLQDPLTARLPGLGVMGVLLGTPGTPLQDSWIACRPLIEADLLYVVNPNEPRAEWLLRVPAALWDALRGRPLETPAPGIKAQPAASFPGLADLVLPPDLQQQAQTLPDLLASGQISALVVRGIGGMGRRTLIGAAAAALGQDVLLCDMLMDEGATREQSARADLAETRKLIGPLALLSHALPILRLAPGPGETADVPTLGGYGGPVGITLGRSGGLRGEALRHALHLTLPPPDKAARRHLWRATGVAIGAESFDEVAERFLLTGGSIHRAASLAETYARLARREAIAVPDVQQALRALNRQTLDTLATPLEAVDGWDALVTSPAVHEEMEALELRCRQREALREKAGPAFAKTLNRGVRAMFSGPSGTGKTLAARVLAGRLQMDLYRVDLASVVNKYIGETERNLNEVLSRAEELDVILLLDEGDALMTRRTDVNNANDRYANLETNYLLQRLEVYEGIVIVTTNAAQRIDPAFMRRLDVVIDFGKPDARERLALWRKHLPIQHAISDAFLWRVAQRCTLTGGQIRNTALHLALLGMKPGAADLPGDDALAEALRREYRKAGIAYPMGEE